MVYPRPIVQIILLWYCASRSSSSRSTQDLFVQTSMSTDSKLYIEQAGPLRPQASQSRWSPSLGWPSRAIEFNHIGASKLLWCQSVACGFGHPVASSSMSSAWSFPPPQQLVRVDNGGGHGFGGELQLPGGQTVEPNSTQKSANS